MANARRARARWLMPWAAPATRDCRAGAAEEQVVHAIHLTINGIAAGLRNSG
jgi:phosphoenolpyruvate carboxylase